VHVAGAACRVAMRIVAGVGDLVQRTGDGRTYRVLSGRAIERSGGAEETRRASFLVELQNQGRRFASGLTSKPPG
jgi:hypothetical protein